MILFAELYSTEDCLYNYLYDHFIIIYKICGEQTDFELIAYSIMDRDKSISQDGILLCAPWPESNNG